MTRYEPGDVARLSVTITTIENVPGDPTELTFTMNTPNADPVAYAWPGADELVRESAGVFSVDWPITQPGTHRYAWGASGTNASYAEGSFIAQPRKVVAATL